MGRLLFNSEWFDEVAPTSLYEREYEQVVLSHKELLFPEYVVVPFKPLVHSEEGSAKPDLALVHKGYREWWVVEVEMGRHSFTGHVFPQVVTLARATYGRESVVQLCRGEAGLDPAKVEVMVKGAPPRVMVLVDSPQPDWVPELRPYNAIVTVLQLFRSKMNRHALRMNGEYPHVPGDLITECSPQPGMSRLLRLSSPGALDFGHDGKVHILFGDQLTTWHRLEAQDVVWLRPDGYSPLSPGGTYQIVKQEDGSLRFKT